MGEGRQSSLADDLNLTQQVVLNPSLARAARM
jgi:hypothetical protein